MVAMKRKLIIIAVLAISLVASYILSDTKQNDVDIDSVKVEEYTAILENIFVPTSFSSQTGFAPWRRTI